MQGSEAVPVPEPVCLEDARGAGVARGVEGEAERCGDIKVTMGSTHRIAEASHSSYIVLWQNASS